MSHVFSRWGTLHPSVFKDAGSLTRWVPVRERKHGAFRYRCPVTGSFVLVTDDDTLITLQRPRARLRCPTCGETHLLTQSAVGPDSVVAEPAGLNAADNPLPPG